MEHTRQVLWTIQLPPDDDCMQVNFLAATEVDGEDE
jgi:hypothetical protein